MRFFTAFGLIFVFAVCGCGISHREAAATFRADYESGNYCAAAGIYISGEGYCSSAPSSAGAVSDFDILADLNGGSALFADKALASALPFFQAADIKIDNYQKQVLLADAGEALTDILINPSVHDYTPLVMDGIYSKAYAILGNLALGDKATARIEVNRAYQKQKEASEVFRAEIKEIKASDAKNKDELSPQNRQALKENRGKIMSGYYADLQKWRGYKDFMNPYVTYLSGLFLLTNGQSAGDFETASMYLKRTAGMMPSNRTVKADLALAEAAASGSKPQDKYVWVIFENGMVATLEELKLDLPMFMVTNEVGIISFAVPRPVIGSSAYNNLKVRSDSSAGTDKGKAENGFAGVVATTELLADIDSIFIAEFNKRFPAILGKAIASTTIKTLAQYSLMHEAAKNDNGAWTMIGALAMTAYTVASTTADLRSWQALPHNVQVARLKAPQHNEAEFVFTTRGREIARIDVPKNKNSIIYIRIPKAETIPSVSVIAL